MSSIGPDALDYLGGAALNFGLLLAPAPGQAPLSESGS